MRKPLASIAVDLSLGVIAATPAFADVSTTQTLPVQACNSGNDERARQHPRDGPATARPHRDTWRCPEPPT